MAENITNIICLREQINFDAICNDQHQTLFSLAPITNKNTISVYTTIIKFLNIILKQGITWASSQKLLDLIKSSYPADISMPIKMYTIRNKLKRDSFFKPQKHYYCSNCNSYLEKTSEDSYICINTFNCGKRFTNEQVKCFSFMYFPLGPQISNIFQKQECIQDLIKCFCERKNTDCTNTPSISLYANCLSSKSLNERCKSNMFISLTLNTDGIQIGHSGSSCWPVIFTIRELSYLKKKSNFIIGALWVGKKGKIPEAAFYPLYKELRNLSVCLIINNQNVEIPIFLNCIVADAPARSHLLKMSYFNGKYSCVFCTIQGETINSGDGTARVFPYSKTIINRTHQAFYSKAKIAHKTHKMLYGIKDLSIVLAFRNLDIINSCCIDYMHGCCLGVFKMVLNDILFNSKHKNKKCFIRSVRKFDDILISFHPPTELGRIPRSIKFKEQFKAKEFRNIFLYYLLPIACSMLPNEILTHLSFLIKGMYLCLEESISNYNLERANYYFHKFVSQIITFYGQEYMKYYCHQLLHIPHSVRYHGTLYLESTFMFESINATIVKNTTSRYDICKQIANRIQLRR